MKLFKKVICLATFCSFSVRAEITAAPVLRIVRKAPLFEGPSSKSKLLAEADPGTPILGRNLSPKGSWILVEDSDGNQGWMPTARTNYTDVASVKDQILPVDPSWDKRGEEAGAPPIELPEEPVVSKELESSRRGGWEISAGYREGIGNNQTNVYPLGLSYLEMTGGQAMGIRADLDLANGDKIPAAWRVSFLGRYPWVGRFFRELDVGYEKKRSEPSLSGLAMGYSLGFGMSSRLAFSLRGGLFWGSTRQWNGELRCRFVF